MSAQPHIAPREAPPGEPHHAGPLLVAQPPAGIAHPTLAAMLLHSCERFTGVALHQRRDRQELSLSYPDLSLQAGQLARGLIALGVPQGARVGILSSTRAEWTLADCAALWAGAVVVPVYHTNSPAECSYVLAHSDTQVVFCEDHAQVAKLLRAREDLPALRHIVLLVDEAQEQPAEASAPTTPAAEVISLARLRQLGADVPAGELEARIQAGRPEQLATLVYTSGTTGPPKGCMLTHANLLAATAMYQQVLSLRAEDVLYQFLPLAHVLARVAQLVVLSVGARIEFWGGDPGEIVAELGELSPTHFPAVPRVYEKIHSAILDAAEESPRLHRALFMRALAQSRRLREAQLAGRRVSPAARLRRTLGDRLVLARPRRRIFGSRLRTALVGAAPAA
ncbi:MAG TPA: AMP-binding protein, partial [Solirubrobacteraceae bacterium]|nr:AMP-binding protein [Solirubrobacteraceae bacterium]